VIIPGVERQQAAAREPKKDWTHGNRSSRHGPAIMNPESEDPPWQAPQHVTQQPSYGASQKKPQAPQAPQLPELPKRAGRGFGCAIAAFIGIVAVLVVGGLIYGGIALYHLKDRIPGAHKEQFQTVAGLNRVLDLTRQQFGDTLGYELGVSPESFSVRRVNPDNPQGLATYYWYSWKGHFGDPTTMGSISSLYSGPPVDLSKFDANAAVKGMHDAPNTLHVDPSFVKNTVLNIQAAKDSPGAVEVQISLDTRKGIGLLVLAPDGTVKRTTTTW
jgi:hypothetical protein